MDDRARHLVRALTSPRACQVVPDLTTFSVDDGFTYLIPEGMDPHIGSRVRIRVSGKRRKGFVTALMDPDPERRLLSIEGVSGDVPSFDAHHLETLRWAATHYVSPLSVLLKRTIPPNVPRRPPASEASDDARTTRATATEAPRYRIGSPPYDEAITEDVGESVDAGRNAVIIAPTLDEVDTIASHLREIHRDRVVVASSGLSGAEVTSSWVRLATGHGSILVGTREVMLWPFGDIGICVVVEDGRRVMRSPATPTLSVREVMMHRAKTEGFPLVFHGPVPTLETVAAGAMIESPGHRQWPMVEVVDRNDEPPTGAVLSERVKAAISASVRADRNAFVLVGSRGYAPAFRCVRCGEIRRCPACSSAASRDDTCRRCGSHLGECSKCGGSRFQALGAGIGRIVDDIARVVSHESVGRVDDGRQVIVGTERDLVGVRGFGLSVAVDVDGMTMAPHYRAAEDGLRLLVRLAQTVSRGEGNRCLIQTSKPDQPVISTLVRGRSEEFLAAELAARRRLGFPPVGSLIAIETDNDPEVDDLLRTGVGSLCSVLGPAPTGTRLRWLLQGGDLTSTSLALRPTVATIRGRGIRVRIDVDPIDL